MSEHKNTIYLIVEYLNGLKEAGVNADTIDTVTGLLEAEFDISTSSSENFGEFSAFPVGLTDIIAAGKKSLGVKKISEALEEAKTDAKYVAFSDAVVKRGYFDGAEEGSLEHLQRSARLLHKYREKVVNAGPSKTELEAQAEEEKIKGNTAINSKDYPGAINHYSEALKLSAEGPNSHVYYCNRAAAYCHTNQYQLAVDDCLTSIALSPDYVKAYSRLGLAYYFMEKFQDAIDAYERAVELEPDNKSIQESLRQARTKAKKVANKSSVTPAASGAEDLPGLSGLMGNPNMKRALDQMGGASGLSSLMKDPQMMAMAQQMMKDPKMMQQAMSMLGGGGGGGMPDLSALAGMMGGLGGDAPPSSSSAPSSSSGKKQFRGFEE